MIASILVLLNTNTLVYLLGFVVSLSCFGCSDCFILQRQGLQRTTAPLFVLNAPVSTDGSSNIANKEIIYNDAINEKEKEETTLLPLSKEPLIMVSSQPLLSQEECKILIEYLEMNKDGMVDPLNDVFFQREGEYVFSTAHESKVSNDFIITKNSIQEESLNSYDAFCENARSIIYRVRREIDRLTNSPSHEGDFALPRFLSFNVEQIPDMTRVGVEETLHTLLPDGLHCDNTNNMLTRHISALLYLSDEVDDKMDELVGGATTFPLATPLHLDGNEKTEWDNQLIKTARNLVNSNKLHSGQRDGANGPDDCILLESAAFSLFYNEALQNNENLLNNIDFPETSMGVRVNPMPGRLCVFHNLLDDGKPDPLAFHAGEAILGKSNKASSIGKKVLLVFFKTIPFVDVSDPDYNELAKESAASRKWIQQQYFKRYE